MSNYYSRNSQPKLPSNNENVPRQQQKLIKKQDIVQAVLTLDQLGQLFELFDDLLNELNDVKNKNNIDTEFHSIIINAKLNIVQSMIKDLKKQNDQQNIDNVQHRIKKYMQTKREDDIKTIQPFLHYLICASQGINVKTIPALSFNEEEVTNNVVNSSNGIMPNLLSSTHKVEKRINEINNNSKSFGEELFNEWMKNGQRGAKFGKHQEPTAEQLFPFVTQPTFNYVQNNRPNIQEDTIENKDDSMNLDDNFDDNNNNNNINIESIIQQLKNNVTNVKYIVKNQKNVLRHGFWFLNDGFNVCMILDNPYNDKAKQCIWNLTWKLIHLEQNYLQVTYMYQNKQIILNITFLDEQEFKLWKIVCNHFSNFIQ